MAKIRVGTCSWTDQTLINSDAFYPARKMTAEDRLKFYAQHFNTVEVDSTFYALPSEKVVGLQTKRTPDDFTLHYKAFGLLTQHSIDPTKLPKAIKEMLPQDIAGASRLRYDAVPDDAKEMAWRMFESALLPAFNAGKLGVVLFQFPPYFIFAERNMDYISECKDRMARYNLAIEFRHGSWTAPGTVDTVLDWLSENELSYVSVDEPQLPGGVTVPPMAISTTDVAYVRFHGRNRENWFKKNISVAERFAYEYAEDELAQWVDKIEKVSHFTKETYVMFNNCFRNYAVKNALHMDVMLGGLTR